MQRLSADVGTGFRHDMDAARGLDVIIFADSALDYPFDVRLSYSHPSGLHDGATESV